MDLVVAVYAAVQKFPLHERYALATQIRRAGCSIPSNIAEGYGRSTRRDYLRFLAIANGSLLELETQILLAARVGYLTEDQTGVLLGLTSEVGRMLARMTAAMRVRTPGH
jgi:four helix bundle protein